MGTYDPLPNRHSEKLCALNVERILYYLSQGIELDEGAAQLLGRRKRRQNATELRRSSRVWSDYHV